VQSITVKRVTLIGALFVVSGRDAGGRLVDEFLMIVCPVVVGGGKRFFPDGVQLDLELIEERRLRNGVIALRYAVRG
jgi:dihydrofolate reductase